MLDDKAASELISKSLFGAVSRDQQSRIDAQLAASEQSRNFARLSKMIQDSVSDIGQRSLNGDKLVSPGLKEDAKQRIKSSIRQESARLSQLGATMVGDSTATGNRTESFSDSHQNEERVLKSRFSLTRKIGQGGLGTVWLAKDEKLDRSVALKEMNADAAEFPRAWDRFQREAEITGHLEHPNVVPLYQFGTDEVTGQPFYAMRFVGKKTLVNAIEAYHDRKAMGEDVTMDLHHLLTAFIGVCHAIAYAHSRGVIHRDLKPENVALDNFGQVIVLDWGLAKVVDEFESEGALSGNRLAADSSAGQTMAGEVIGTPLYMAPEQASGNLNDIDERTDVYGLGAILFAMLTGVAPHQNSSISQGGPVAIPDLLQSIANQPTPAPRDHSPGIPADLEAICTKAMQFKAHTRFQSATEVAESVQRWMAGRSERRQKYANSRSEGRELRTAMLSAIRDLERNVRFMSSLPPIQGLADAYAERGTDDISVWRERLAVIYKGLLRTNCDFTSVSFARVESDEFKELLRIERQTSDTSHVRSIPTSRLASGPLTSCIQKAMDGNPDEVYVALSSECPEPNVARDAGRIAAVVPVFDSTTEDIFGFVMIEACLEQLIEGQIRGRFRTINQLFVLDNDGRVLMQIDGKGSRISTNNGRDMAEINQCWNDVIPHLKSTGEFVDEQDHAFYATRVDLVPGRYSLTLAMCLAEKQTI